MDSRLLRSHMAREGKSGVKMAAELGISYSSWVLKSKGQRSFTVDEAVRVKDILSLTNEQTGEIFFVKNVD